MLILSFVLNFDIMLRCFIVFKLMRAGEVFEFAKSNSNEVGQVAIRNINLICCLKYGNHTGAVYEETRVIRSLQRGATNPRPIVHSETIDLGGCKSSLYMYLQYQITYLSFLKNIYIFGKRLKLYRDF